MDDTGRSRLDQLLDILADEVARRLEARSETHTAEPAPPPQEAPSIVPPLAASEATLAAAPTVREVLPTREPTREPPPDIAVPANSHAASLMARLAIGVLIIVVLINIPLNAQGTALARAIPSSAALVIANGLVVKESSSPDIYVYRDGAFHWITSLDAFDYFGYRWPEVHIVEPGFLSQFDKGSPIYVLLKCDGSPNIYRLESGRKRWIVDIPTFEAQGYVWEDVKFMPCTYLHNLPDGDSIPPGRGSPPPPLP
jgi:hypothetical protein